METVDTQYAEAIPYFRGLYSFLSNFHEEPVIYNQEQYPSVENAYQAQKTADLKLRKAFMDSALSPGMAKALGRSLKIRPDWDRVRDQIMLELVRSKFSNPKLRTKLGHTGTRFLFEGNNWHDIYWGICNGEHGNYKSVEAHPGIVMGHNKLGKILEKVRYEIWWNASQQPRNSLNEVW